MKKILSLSILSYSISDLLGEEDRAFVDDFKSSEIYEGITTIVAFALSKSSTEKDEDIIEEIADSLKDTILKVGTVDPEDAYDAAWDIIEGLMDYADPEDKFDFVADILKGVLEGFFIGEKPFRIKAVLDILGKNFAEGKEKRALRRKERKNRRAERKGKEIPFPELLETVPDPDILDESGDDE